MSARLTSARAARIRLIPPTAAAAAAVALCVFGITYGTFAAADTDPYGYVSQADLIANGTLRIDQDLARTMPWPNAGDSFVPPGYTLDPDRRYAVPVYSSGLPLLMGAAQRLTSTRLAVFFVVPLLGAVLVWMTYCLGRDLGNPATGAVSSLLLAASPVALYHVTPPTSDVPAAAWWTAALALAVRGTSTSALLAGASASMAIVTRPNLAPLAAVIAVCLALDSLRTRLHRNTWTALRPAVMFSLGSVPGSLAVAFINNDLHGSPLRSGYGSLGAMFGPENLLPNLDRYPRWLLGVHTVLIFLGLLAPWLTRGRFVWLLFAFIATLFGLTALYYPFGRDEWAYLRFLLPGLPALIVLGVVVFGRLLSRFVPDVRLRTPVAALTLVCLLIWQVGRAEALGVFTAYLSEKRYVDVGMYADAVLPANALVIAQLHAGSLQYYSGRPAINAGRLQARSLDDAIAAVSARGYAPWIVLEEGERESFRARFPNQVFGRLDWPPRHRTFEGIVVSIWDPLDRSRFLAGEVIPTYDIGMRRRPILMPVE